MSEHENDTTGDPDLTLRCTKAEACEHGGAPADCEGAAVCEHARRAEPANAAETQAPCVDQTYPPGTDPVVLVRKARDLLQKHPARLDWPQDDARDLLAALADALADALAQAAAWEGAADGLLARIAPQALDVAEARAVVKALRERGARVELDLRERAERAEVRVAPLERVAEAARAWRDTYHDLDACDALERALADLDAAPAAPERCPHSVRHPHPCRECEDAAPAAAPGQVPEKVGA